MIVIDKMEQGSEEWLNARKGRATASEFKNILTPTGRPSKSAVAYMRKLTAECVVDDPMVFMGNKYTDWGHEHEPHARALFSKMMEMDVVEVGMCLMGERIPVSCSPDGLIVECGSYIGGLEIKCPQRDKHVEYVMEGKLPDEYKLQVHGSMAVTELPFWYFMSYFPGLKPLIIKVERDAFTEKVREALEQFVIDYAVERKAVLDAIVMDDEDGEEMPL